MTTVSEKTEHVNNGIGRCKNRDLLINMTKANVPSRIINRTSGTVFKELLLYFTNVNARTTHWMETEHNLQ